MKVGIGWVDAGSITSPVISDIIKISVVILYFPTAKIFLPTSRAASTVGGTSRVIASAEVVVR